MGELGTRLQRAREARGLTLEDAERDTRISRRYLDALEHEQFQVIPAPVYARGFLRSYSQYLGMDPAETLLLFPREDGSPAPVPPVNGAPVRPSMSAPVSPTSQSRPTWRKPPRFDSGKPPAQPEPRPRRREPPPPLRERPMEVAIGGAVEPEEQVIDFGAVPVLGTAPIPEDMIIGGEPVPSRRINPSPGGNQKALIFVGGAIGLLVFVILLAFLISNVGGGGGEDDAAPTNSATTSGTRTLGAATGAATASGTVARQGVVPNLKGLTEEKATEAIKGAGLAVRVRQEKNAAARGIVIEQAPGAGQALPAGSEVIIVVSDGP